MGFFDRVFIAGILAGLGLLFFGIWYANKDEPQLRAECEKRGGVLIQARSPLYVCVMEPPNAEITGRTLAQNEADGA